MTTHRRIRRLVPCTCPTCLGSTYQYVPGGGHQPCATCKGTGQVEKWVTELVSEGEGVGEG